MAQTDLQVEEGIRNRSFQTVNVCKTEFWVIQQNRKYLLEFHFRLGDPTEYNFHPGKLPEHCYIRTGTETSRLLQPDQSRLLTSGLYRLYKPDTVTKPTESRPRLSIHCLEPVL